MVCHCGFNLVGPDALANCLGTVAWLSMVICWAWRWLCGPLLGMCDRSSNALGTNYMGGPQPRNWLYLIVFRDHQDYKRFTWPDAIEPMILDELFDPTNPTDDLNQLPKGQRAHQHAQQSQQEQLPESMHRNWIADTGISSFCNGSTKVKPSYACPCFNVVMNHSG